MRGDSLRMKGLHQSYWMLNSMMYRDHKETKAQVEAAAHPHAHAHEKSASTYMVIYKKRFEENFKIKLLKDIAAMKEKMKGIEGGGVFGGTNKFQAVEEDSEEGNNQSMSKLIRMEDGTGEDPTFNTINVLGPFDGL